MGMRKKVLKLASVLSVATVASLSVVSCSANRLNFESSVQLIVSDSSSTLADKSFSESSYDGIKQYFKTEHNIDMPAADDSSIKENNGLWKRPGADTTSRIATYSNAFKDGSKVVVATGYNQQDALQQVTSRKAENQQYKNTFNDSAFIFVDGLMNSADTTYDSDPYNISSISYRADDGSFLAGISTAVFLNKYQDYFGTKDSSGKVTMLGASSFVGLALPSTLNFFNGFRLGLHYWNKILQPLIKYVDEGKSKETLPITWVTSKQNGQNEETFDLSDFRTNSFSATEPRANVLTDGMRANGANSIFPIAGPQTSLVVSRIASNQKGTTPTTVLGVDTAQENIDSLKSPLDNGANIGNGNIIQFSSTKNLKDSTASVLKAITDTNLKLNGKQTEWSADINGGYYGLGWNNVGTVSNAGVGVSDAGLQYLINPNWNNWTSLNLTDFANLSLEKVLSTDGMVAKQLSTSDPVISEYKKLLEGTFNTKTNSSTQKADDLNSKAIGLISKADGKNAPNDDGNWKIQNGSNGVTNTISVALSKYIKAIKDGGKEVTYQVAATEAKYVGVTEVKEGGYDYLSKNNMFFRKL